MQDEKSSISTSTNSTSTQDPTELPLGTLNRPSPGPMDAFLSNSKAVNDNKLKTSTLSSIRKDDGIRKFLIKDTDNQHCSETMLSDEENSSDHTTECCSTKLGQIFAKDLKDDQNSDKITNVKETLSENSASVNVLPVKTGIQRFLTAQSSREERIKMEPDSSKSPSKRTLEKDNLFDKDTNSDSNYLNKKTGIETYFSNKAEMYSTAGCLEETVHLPSTSTQLNNGNVDVQNDDVENVDVVACEKCGENVSAWFLPEHLDYHFAKELQEQETIARIEPPKKKLKTAGKISSFFSSNN